VIIARYYNNPHTPATAGLIYASGMNIPDSARDLLATGPYAHLVTRHPDGRLHVTLAWAGLDGDELIFSTFYDRHKIADIRRDPRVTLSFQANEHRGEGLHPYLVIDGLARVIEGGALEVMDALAPAYIGPGATFPMRDAPAGATFRATIERIYGMGPWRGATDG
jgi:PPOX class probable F420-dependent enzyme